MALKLSKREKILLYSLFCIILIAGGVTFLVLPAFSRSAEAKSELDNLEMQVQEMQIIQNKYDNRLALYNELTESTATLYQNYFLNTVTDEELDIFITKTALDIGIAPQNLTINIPGFLPINSYTATAVEEQPEENTKKIIGSIVTNIVVNGECSYEEFVKLIDAYENKTQLHIVSALFQKSTEAEATNTFSISLDVYTLPPHGTGVSYFEGN